MKAARQTGFMVTEVRGVVALEGGVTGKGHEGTLWGDRNALTDRDVSHRSTVFVKTD